MNCEFCLNNFNDNINKPLILTNCGHKICSECEKNANKNCPKCKSLIERTLSNLIVNPSKKENNILTLEHVEKGKYFINTVPVPLMLS
jgi:hypothetical protein